MRAFVALFLLFLFLVQTFSSFVLDGTYWLNRDYVSQSLCVNKNKPSLHCGGKCFLVKQIGNETKNDTSAGGKKEREETTYFFPVYLSATAAFLLIQPLFNTISDTRLFSKHCPLLLRPPGSLRV